MSPTHEFVYEITPKDVEAAFILGEMEEIEEQRKALRPASAILIQMQNLAEDTYDRLVAHRQQVIDEYHATPKLKSQDIDQDVHNDTDSEVETILISKKATKKVKPTPKRAKSTPKQKLPRHQLPTPSPTPSNPALELSESGSRSGTISSRSSMAPSSAVSVPGSGLSTGRKRKAQDDGEKPKKQKQKRDGSNSKLGFPDALGGLIKLAFAHRQGDLKAEDVIARGKYNYGRNLAPAHGPGSDHYEDLIELAADLGYSKEKENLGEFWIHFYRLWEGTAILTEHNARSKRQSHPGKGFQPQSIGLAAVQRWLKLDVDKTSEMFRRFVRWGWVPGAWKNQEKEQGFDADFDSLERQMSAAIRQELFEEMIKYEEEHRPSKMAGFYRVFMIE